MKKTSVSLLRTTQDNLLTPSVFNIKGKIVNIIPLILTFSAIQRTHKSMERINREDQELRDAKEIQQSATQTAFLKKRKDATTAEKEKFAVGQEFTIAGKKNAGKVYAVVNVMPSGIQYGVKENGKTRGGIFMNYKDTALRITLL